MGNGREWLTDAVARDAQLPEKGMRIVWDYGPKAVRRFGLRVTYKGAKSFLLTYRKNGIQRSLTIGSWPDWTAKDAREAAKQLKQDIDRGGDPQGERQAERRAPTVNDLADYYIEHHLPRKRPLSQADDLRMLKKYIRPLFGRYKVEQLDHKVIEREVRKATAGLVKRGNSVLALVSTMYTLAVREGWASKNPTKGIPRTPEERRERYLKATEVERLLDVLDSRNNQSADIIKLALFTGGRRAEVMGALWNQFDLDAGIWVKPPSATKQKRIHRVPLNEAALTLLKRLAAHREGDAVFPSPFRNPTRKGTRSEIWHEWNKVRNEAGLPDVRFHDLRHSYASFLINSGVQLQHVGRLLGHSDYKTTLRYAHLSDSSLREATNKLDNVIPLKRRSAA